MKVKLVIAAVFLLGYAMSSSGQIVVIANKSVPVDTLAKTDVLDLYSGDIRKWSDGQSVVVLDLRTTGNVSGNFYKFLGKSSSRMKSIWLKKMLSGEGDPPVFITSEQELLKKVATTPGAIGYLQQQSISNEVKVLVAVTGNE